ncbi:Hypothetical predicted protein [Mytilus galloprovincialis]|uniref:Uncharacterized protein n=1 Tax=Mytilus galloprovincialis TaxID=29158 RepID=A0A8B6HDS6_MYTGA|nr:Hypothetical predicted protein [Mytilus galloprovincialis]
MNITSIYNILVVINRLIFIRWKNILDEGGWDVMAGSREESTSQSVMERASVGLMRIKARRELKFAVLIMNSFIVCCYLQDSY